MFIQHFVPPPTKIYDYLKKLPDKHHMNHIMQSNTLWYYHLLCKRSCPSHIISHKIFMLLQQRLSVASSLHLFNEWRIGLKKSFCPNKKTKWFNNCSYSDWYKFRYLRNTTSCLCNCSPIILNNKQSQPVVLNSHHTVPSQWYSIPHYLLYTSVCHLRPIIPRPQVLFMIHRQVFRYVSDFYSTTFCIDILLLRCHLVWKIFHQDLSHLNRVVHL